MHSHRGRNLIGSVGGLEGVLRRQFLKAAIATGAVGAAMGPRMVLSRPNRQLGPFFRLVRAGQSRAGGEFRVQRFSPGDLEERAESLHHL